jgi:hypothetical protein
MKTCLAALIILSVVSVTATAEPWDLSADLNLTLAQNYYSNNWDGDETGSITWQFNSNSLAEKQIKPWLINKNTLKLFFGQTHKQDKETNKWESPEKSTDLIDLESTFRIPVRIPVDPIVAVRVITQFIDKKDPAKYRWVNPIDITESIGVARVFIKEEKREWIARVGVGFSQNVNRDKLDPDTGMRETKTITSEGFEFVNDFKTPLAEEKILFTSKLTVFQSVFSSEKDKLKETPQENDWKYPDINFENILSINLTKYLIMNFYAQILYDREISKAGRLKQTMALGITYKLM